MSGFTSARVCAYCNGHGVVLRTKPVPHYASGATPVDAPEWIVCPQCQGGGEGEKAIAIREEAVEEET